MRLVDRLFIPADELSPNVLGLVLFDTLVNWLLLVYDVKLDCGVGEPDIALADHYLLSSSLDVFARGKPGLYFAIQIKHVAKRLDHHLRCLNTSEVLADHL